ncbi:sporulation related protein [Dyadobacter jejuensis]|uniref:Sporulation related protein n=1 Tax=Dyadobacter jejuensis TaxID=1082580 RepID=A0A316AQJ3_9BACT|nr:SPOR domain-containing protein [Dyadobacter jejuensis]PWJ59862.1 sporulation related protein [Dyadobacter jejuensis]
MRLFNKVLLAITLLGNIFLAGCAKKTYLRSSTNIHSEDLSSVRPRYDYEAPVISGTFLTNEKENKPETNDTKRDNPDAVNKQLDKALAALADQNKSIKYISGFRIQLYVGNVRQQADDAKSYIYRQFPELVPYISYSQPTYRVKAGDFMYRADAQSYLEQIKDIFPSAVILTDRVDIKKSFVLNSAYDN